MAADGHLRTVISTLGARRQVKQTVLTVLMLAMLVVNAVADDAADATERERKARNETQKRLRNAVADADWQAVVALCSDRVQSAIRQQPDPDAFLIKIIPVAFIAKRTHVSNSSSSSVSMRNGEMTRSSQHFMVVRLSERESSIAVTWRAELIAEEDKCVVEFEPIPLAEQIKRLPTSATVPPKAAANGGL